MYFLIAKFWETYLKLFKVKMILGTKVIGFVDGMLILARTVKSKMLRRSLLAISASI